MPDNYEREGQYRKPGSASKGALDQHYPSNPGVLLGHQGKDLTAVSGREEGEQDPPGPGGAPPIPPFNS